MNLAPVVTGQWLARFRWAVVAGAAATLLVGQVALDLQFPIAIAAGALAMQGASNLWLMARLGRASEAPQPTLGAIVLLDVVLLTLLILVTGGPSNPFTIAYLVYITLAAVTLNARWTWAVATASIAGYGLLFVTPLRAPFDPHAAHAAMQPALGHQVGMWVAFLVAALLTASFVTRIRLALESRERALAEARRARRAAGEAGVADDAGGRRGARAGDAARDHRRGGPRAGPAQLDCRRPARGARGCPPDPRPGGPLPRDPRSHERPRR